MNKESELVEMACILDGKCKPGNFDCRTCSILSEFGCIEYEGAIQLQKAGYGKVRDAVKKYVEVLKMTMADDEFEQLCQDGAVDQDTVFNYIDTVFEKFFENK